tara:strand:+ start:95 stop:364 length:270 start_codon:yes stop_codon:yes gene_type:complete
MINNKLNIGDVVVFNSEFRSKVPFPFEGVGLVTKIYPRETHNGYVGDKRYDVLFPVGKLLEIPRTWVIKISPNLSPCPLEEENKMWGDR